MAKGAYSFPDLNENGSVSFDSAGSTSIAVRRVE
jgi:hypothetical protein